MYFCMDSVITVGARRVPAAGRPRGTGDTGQKALMPGVIYLEPNLSLLETWPIIL